MHQCLNHHEEFVDGSQAAKPIRSHKKNISYRLTRNKKEFDYTAPPLSFQQFISFFKTRITAKVQRRNMVIRINGRSVYSLIRFQR